MANRRTTRICTLLFFLTSAAALTLAGYAGWAFDRLPVDQVLLQMVFYGAWSSLIGAWAFGCWAVAVEEDACSSMDMGVISSMGAFFGSLACGLAGTAAVGLALTHGWLPIFAITVALAALHACAAIFLPTEIRRHPHIDARGRACGEAGAPLSEEQQPLRMRDRMSILLGLAFALFLSLTLVMALMMGSNLGHPVMMAPMMYGMFGTMLGGMMGGWLAGVMDEHQGAPEHENPIMVAAMALMAGMMGGMPSGMIGGMMGVMGDTAVAITIAYGVAFAVCVSTMVLWKRYRIGMRAPQSETDVAARRGGAKDDSRIRASEPKSLASRENEMSTSTGETKLSVKGMHCDGCVSRITSKVGALAGVSSVAVQLERGIVEIAWGDGFAGVGAVQERIRALGYTVE